MDRDLRGLICLPSLDQALYNVPTLSNRKLELQAEQSLRDN
jgi:hypothetical protein